MILRSSLCFSDRLLGRQIDQWGYVHLQRQLSSKAEPVQVVDISELDVAEIKIGDRVYKATPRKTLQSLIEAIAEQDPKAIGVDIDFSPDSNGYITPQDPEFFQFCLDQPTSVFLGIQRSQVLPASAWLGGEQYERLAANITIPNETRRLPSSIQTNRNYKSCPTMSAALASAFGKSSCRFAELLQRVGLASQSLITQLGQTGRVVEFPVDYGALDAMMKDRLRTINPDVVRDQGRLLRGKIVLVGNGTLGKGKDTFVVPGEPQSIPGVFMHASAVYTLVSAPLYELSWKGRLLIDCLLIMIVLILVLLGRLIFRKTRMRAAPTWSQGLFTFVVVIGAFIFGVIFVHMTCVLWSDFILALGAVVLHPSIERRVDSSWKFIKTIGPSVLRS